MQNVKQMDQDLQKWPLINLKPEISYHQNNYYEKPVLLFIRSFITRISYGM